jgi:hypothetical protein
LLPEYSPFNQSVRRADKLGHCVLLFYARN